ncbi:hypothetical protein RJ639_017093 [Escallonia herrerae]|uniref:CASP-like protein n=1 Tax=Escallonia herrerae TaxID=1293975 RepID=A0AA88VE14_9ASTE|nr:hypothetical protein RJ639_017093 [Escallonia herrerae]
MDATKSEAFLRLATTLLLLMTALLVLFDSQTKLIYSSILRKATYKDLNALFVLVLVEFSAASYNLLQLVRYCIASRFMPGLIVSHKNLAWICFWLDQVAVYTVFAANSAALAASLLAVTGSSGFQWMGVCNIYARFCFQIGGALVCGYFASLLMALVSSISAFSLFRLYSSKHFLLLKGK